MLKHTEGDLFERQQQVLEPCTDETVENKMAGEMVNSNGCILPIQNYPTQEH